MMRRAVLFAAASLFGMSPGLAQPAHVAGIAHVAFRVADLEAARAFYHKLGFEQFFEMKQGERTTEAFLKINDHQFIELYPRTSPSQEIGLMHVCYESNDLEALHAELAGRGVTVSDVRKAGAGNLLMTLKDPEGQTIEYTQYMPGSRHFEDRGKHLGEKRVAPMLMGATTPAHDVAAMRAFYVEKLGFAEIGAGNPVRLRLPGDSRQELGIGGKPGVQFGSADHEPMTDPDGMLISFIKK